jgi:uncharacterized membrane protein
MGLGFPVGPAGEQLPEYDCGVARPGETTQAPARTEAEPAIFVEPRWPIAVTVLAFITLTIVLRVEVPNRMSVGPGWLIPGIEILLLLALIAAHPGRLGSRAVWLRRCSIVLILSLAAAAVWGTVLLTTDLIRGGPVTNSASTLLASGSLIWVGNNLVFGLLYWEFDTGGALARYHGTGGYPDFAFPQQLNPELAPPEWRAGFVDYLYIGFTNGTAFSPTDVMPLTPWAKLTMALQSVISLVVIGLVVARAVNVFT